MAPAKTGVAQAGEHGEPLEGSCGSGRRTVRDCGFSVAVPAASGVEEDAAAPSAANTPAPFGRKAEQAIEKAKAAQDEQGRSRTAAAPAPRLRAQASQRATRLLLRWLRPPRVKDS